MRQFSFFGCKTIDNGRKRVSVENLKIDLGV